MYKCKFCQPTYTRQIPFYNHLMDKHQRKVLNTSRVGSTSMLNDPNLTVHSKKNGMYIIFNFSIKNLNN